MGTNSHKTLCLRECGRETLDWTGVCSCCRRHNGKRKQRRKGDYLSIEEIRRREMMDGITSDIQNGWFYPDEKNYIPKD
jgi:hypothetical protein